MIFTTHNPSADIAPYIESIFHYEKFIPDHSVERVVPTGHIFLIFELDGFTRHTYDNESLQPNANFTRAWFSGMHRNYISISAHENSEMLVVQFKPYGSFPFLHASADLLNDLVVPAHEVVGEELYTLREKFTACDSAEKKLTLANEWLQNRFDSANCPQTELVEFLSLLESEPANSLNDLIAEYPASQKKLINEFKKFVGLTPKYYQRILRFNDLLKRIQSKDTICWTDIAQDCGYFDQSHFIKEFRHFSGFNPAEYISNDYNRDGTNFFPLDREG